MSKRKTIAIVELVKTVNEMLKSSAPEAAAVRQGMMLVLEETLHRSGNYRGFRYLLAEEVAGRPGINYLNGLPHPDLAVRFADTDRTRVAYYA